MQPALIKIVLTGPESSGKTTLAKALAEHYQVPLVPEYAREYLENIGLAYTQNDLLQIAKGQAKLKAEYLAQNPSILISDTDQVVMKVWSEVRFQTCHPWIIEQLNQSDTHLYILCQPDIPWEYDALREDETSRDMLYERYLETLEQFQLPYLEVGGALSKRCQIALETIQQLQKEQNTF